MSIIDRLFSRAGAAATASAEGTIKRVGNRLRGALIGLALAILVAAGVVAWICMA